MNTSKNYNWLPINEGLKQSVNFTVFQIVQDKYPVS